MADALHQAAVAGNCISVVAANLNAMFLVLDALRERHADGVREPLAKRSGYCLDANRMAIFGVASGVRTQLAEGLEIFDLHSRIASQIEQRILQHRAVTGREHEAVAIGPIGLRGTKF